MLFDQARFQACGAMGPGFMMFTGNMLLVAALGQSGFNFADEVFHPYVLRDVFEP